MTSRGAAGLIAAVRSAGLDLPVGRAWSAAHDGGPVPVGPTFRSGVRIGRITSQISISPRPRAPLPPYGRGIRPASLSIEMWIRLALHRHALEADHLPGFGGVHHAAAAGSSCAARAAGRRVLGNAGIQPRSDCRPSRCAPFSAVKTTRKLVHARRGEGPRKARRSIATTSTAASAQRHEEKRMPQETVSADDCHRDPARARPSAAAPGGSTPWARTSAGAGSSRRTRGRLAPTRARRR